MPNASTTATTATTNVSAPSNVHYSLTEPTGITFQVTPHAPTPMDE